MTRLSRFLPLLFWLTLIFVYIVAILPPGDLPPINAPDKVQHIAAFFTLSVLAGLAMPKIPLLRVAIGLAFFGAFIEFTQMVPTLHRDPSVADWLADIAAIAVAMLIVSPLRRLTEAAA